MRVRPQFVIVIYFLATTTFFALYLWQNEKQKCSTKRQNHIEIFPNSHCSCVIRGDPVEKLNGSQICTDCSRILTETGCDAWRKNVTSPTEQRLLRALNSVNCSRLISGDTEEQMKAKVLASLYTPNLKPEVQYRRITNNCTSFLHSRKYIPRKVTPEELSFPLAFTIIAYTDLELLERLLRAIYRPHNYYCIHLDRKATTYMRYALTDIVSCFQNVFIASKSFTVTWGEISLVDAQLQCMKDLLEYKLWKYQINLSGQELPLKTNRELVQLLRSFNETNEIVSDFKIAERYSSWNDYSWPDANAPSYWKKSPPPHGIRLARGALFMAVTRDFVHYVINDPVASEFLQWSRDTHIPDELYFQTLNANPSLGVPGSSLNQKRIDKGCLARYYRWVLSETDFCGGQVIRQVCNFGIEDLPSVTSAPHMFANKFRLDFEPITYRCMEEWLANKEEEE